MKAFQTELISCDCIHTADAFLADSFAASRTFERMGRTGRFAAQSAIVRQAYCAYMRTADFTAFHMLLCICFLTGHAHKPAVGTYRLMVYGIGLNALTAPNRTTD